jgi:anti-sigma factor RsiW
MDHKMVETLESVDKYLLNELSSDERTHFEEHMFDCPICSDQVRENFTVTENLKEVLREEKARATVQVSELSRGGWWRGWLSVPSLVPTFAALALACVLGYQDYGGGSQMARVLPPPAAVLMPVSRGDNGLQVQVNRQSPLFEIEVKGDSRQPDSFAMEFQNAAGGKVLALNSGAQKSTDFDLKIQVPVKSFPAGRYELILRPASEPDRLITYPFEIRDSH